MLTYSEIIDISWPISPTMTAYKDQKTVQFVATKTFESDHVRSSLVTMSSHTGTHIDAPSHFLRDGVSVEKIALQYCVGICTVIDLTGVADFITQQDLQRCDIKPGSIMLAKTANSLRSATEPFDYNFVALHADAAAFLVEKKIKTFGIDYLGIERAQPGHPTHKTLLASNICIIEGLRLGGVEPGVYTLCCLPLAFEGLDGAPSRAVLLR